METAKPNLNRETSIDDYEQRTCDRLHYWARILPSKKTRGLFKNCELEGSLFFGGAVEISTLGELSHLPRSALVLKFLTTRDIDLAPALLFWHGDVAHTG